MNLNPKFVEAVKGAIAQNPQSMAEAARMAEMHFGTFKRYAQLLQLYETNQSGLGLRKNNPRGKILLADILAGKHPSYATIHLKERIIKEGVLANSCQGCPVGNTWNGFPLILHLDHINGDSNDHRLENLKLLCPNCHSQTETYGGRNAKKQRTKSISESEYLAALSNSRTIHGAIVKLGVVVSKHYYSKCIEVLEKHPELEIPYHKKPESLYKLDKTALLSRNKEAWLTSQRALLDRIAADGFDFNASNWKTLLGRKLNKSTATLTRWLVKVHPELFSKNQL